MHTPHDQYDTAEMTPSRGRPDRLVLACGLVVALAFLARLVLSWYAIGTNDAVTWLKFAHSIDERGLFDAYWRFPRMNHPPLPALWAAGALRLSRLSGMGFEFIFRLPALLADAACCVLLAVIWQRRRPAGGAGGARRWGWLAAAAMAANLGAVLVSAYHCNTDSIYAFFILLACFFAQQRNMLRAGLALSAAINVKLIPVLLILPLLSLCRDRRDALRFLGALCIGVIPFMPVLARAGPHFARNALGYKSEANRWGISFVLHELNLHEPTRRFALDAMSFYYETGRWVILAAVVLLSFFSWRRRGRWNGYQLGTATLAMFLVLTPGFGVQYTVALAPLLLALGLIVGSSYGLLAGLFLLLIYAANWTGTVPMFSLFDGPFPMPGAIVGACLWAMLLYVAIHILARRNVE